MDAAFSRSSSGSGNGTRVSRRAALLGGLGGVVLGATPLTGAAGGTSAGDPSRQPPDTANAWMAAVYDVVWPEDLTPTNAARVYNYIAIAMYEAVVPGTQHLRSLGGQLSGLGRLPKPPSGRLDWPAVLTGSVSTVADHLFTDASETSKELLARTFASQVGARKAAGTPKGVLTNSLDHGRRIGRALTEWIADDGYDGIAGRTYTPPEGPDKWQPTPPNYRSAVEPYWSQIRPMILRDAAEIVPDPHLPFSADEGSDFWEQAMTVYRTAQELTDEQRAIARFWTDNPLLSGLPSGHWMLIASQVSDRDGLSLTDTVEAYARLGVALHDAFLNCWTWKYRLNLLRPVTYVRRYIDPEWNTFVNSPQFPEYTSGHSVASRAAATVLTDLLGSRAFVDDSHAPRGMPARSFTSFMEAADEAAQSRLYGNIHYPMGIEAGKVQGDRIGALVIERLRTRR
ncbi:vanadium-dependent haloperoxidase [Phytoactinopolyspora halotolerans]|uniref:Vanadium-dependent haloperoxidase n=1 Tax=Phytoactinopolyspora halotolerans TaxID=1981512 RepID=A0A6L9SAB3_9ACTN|nr:vanadium-dependent haloperoxidase [Phytoactinopolyspora halotolerans]NEE01571.1 vanadium-dependent haloperoxidase [Phytoactinopolyspora halotolerans]